MKEKEIWKFQLSIDDKVFISMPKDAEILSIQNQNGSVCIWALVDPYVDVEDMCFEVFVDGQQIDFDSNVNRKFIGTVQLSDGTFVVHVF